MILMPRTTQKLAEGKPRWVPMNENQRKAKATGKSEKWPGNWVLSSGFQPGWAARVGKEILQGLGSLTTSGTELGTTSQSEARSYGRFWSRTTKPPEWRRARPGALNSENKAAEQEPEPESTLLCSETKIVAAFYLSSFPWEFISRN